VGSDFRRLWLADAISQLGTRMTFFAAPLVAVISLHATTFEVAMVRTAQSLGALLLGLAAGALVDRMRCRPVLLTTDVGRFVLLASIPAAALAGVLTIEQLYLVMFGVGVLTMFFDVAHQSYLPRLLPADQLVGANAKLAANASIAALLGSGTGGFLVQWLTAPLVIMLDALSMLWSAAWIRSLRHREERPAVAPDRHLGREIGEGLRFVVRHPLLRAIAGNTATTVFCQSVQVVTVVFLVREIGLSPATIGLLSTVGLLGALLAAAVTTRLATAIGQSRLMWLVGLAEGPAFLLVAFTQPGWGLAWYVASMLLATFGIIALNVLQVTCRQLLCPPRLLGRVSATMEFVLWSVAPLGSLVGGILGEVIGLRETLAVSGAAACLAALWLLPFRRRRDFPALAD
jgi:MFS family permease